MMRQWLKRVGWKAFGRKEGLNVQGFAPAYDAETIALSRWPSKWSQAIPFAVGNEASEDRLRGCLKGWGAERGLLLFIGHGCETALLTARELSTREMRVGAYTHGVLCACSDVPSVLSLEVVAWACYAGGDFGRSLGGRSDCRVLGFSGKLSFVFGEEKAELLWSGIVEGLMTRVVGKGRLEAADRDWLEERLREVRRDIIQGRIDAGSVGWYQDICLRKAAGMVVFYEGGV
jgi:hypothetical protein